MTPVVVLLRVVLACIAIFATFNFAQEDSQWWATFTSEGNLLMAAVFLWSAWALIARRPQPPVWVLGAITTYLLIVAIVYAAILGYPDPLPEPVLFGLANTQLHHLVTPVGAFVLWVLVVPHRQIAWKWAFLWLVYFYVYLAVVVVRAQVDPNAGYVYDFIDVEKIGFGGLAIAVAIYSVAFAAIGALVIGIDRLLPAKTRFTVGVN